MYFSMKNSNRWVIRLFGLIGENETKLENNHNDEKIFLLLRVYYNFLYFINIKIKNFFVSKLFQLLFLKMDKNMDVIFCGFRVSRIKVAKYQSITTQTHYAEGKSNALLKCL